MKNKKALILTWEKSQDVELLYAYKLKGNYYEINENFYCYQ